MARQALFVASNKGQGHIVRSRALMSELASRGWNCSMVPHNPPPTNAEVVVLDGVGVEEAARYPNAKLVRIVDEPGTYICDLLVCGGAWENWPGFLGEGAVRGGRTVLCGPQYALLRKEFRAARNKIRTPAAFPCDLRGAINKTAEHLADAILNHIPVFTFGGMRCMEAACVGAPMYAIARNPGEWLNVETLARAGAAIGVKYKADKYGTMEDVMLAMPISDPVAMIEAGRALVDGRGCQRVADAMETL